MSVAARRACGGAWLTAAVLLIGRTCAHGHGSIPTDVPVDRLVTNLTKYVQEHPDDADGYYRLGRVHTLALETRSGFVPAFDRPDRPRPGEGFWVKHVMQREKRPETATVPQLQQHLREAVAQLNRAIELRPAEARYRLTLACALEAGAAFMDDVDVWPLCPVPGALQDPENQSAIQFERESFASLPTRPATVDELIERMRNYHWNRAVRDAIMTLAYDHRDRPEFKDAVQKLRQADWREQIEQQYFTAMCLALPGDGKASEKPVWGGLEDWVSYEAGVNFRRVVEGRPARPADTIRLRIVRETIRAFEELPKPRAITPIVLDFHSRAAAELVAAQPTAFDLDGTGRPQRWSWVKPDVGILVWDPDRSGRIASGRQLFGSVSWWVFFDHGYDALDALDDDRDGQLSGDEARGLSLWFDRDGNGVSDRGEVIPLARLGVEAISCRAPDRDGSTLANRSGARLSDGRAVATYDWIAVQPATLD